MILFDDTGNHFLEDSHILSLYQEGVPNKIIDVFLQGFSNVIFCSPNFHRVIEKI